MRLLRLRNDRQRSPVVARVNRKVAPIAIWPCATGYASAPRSAARALAKPVAHGPFKHSPLQIHVALLATDATTTLKERSAAFVGGRPGKAQSRADRNLAVCHWVRQCSQKRRSRTGKASGTRAKPVAHGPFKHSPLNSTCTRLLSGPTAHGTTALSRRHAPHDDLRTLPAQHKIGASLSFGTGPQPDPVTARRPRPLARGRSPSLEWKLHRLLWTIRLAGDHRAPPKMRSKRECLRWGLGYCDAL
jgi:hypothetical protein